MALLFHFADVEPSCIWEIDDSTNRHLWVFNIHDLFSYTIIEASNFPEFYTGIIEKHFQFVFFYI